MTERAAWFIPIESPSLTTPPCTELEIQGDHAERLVDELLKAGYKAKRSGG